LTEKNDFNDWFENEWGNSQRKTVGAVEGGFFENRKTLFAAEPRG
jgi:hypothetical protein